MAKLYKCMRFRVGESINNRDLVSVEKPALVGVGILTATWAFSGVGLGINDFWFFVIAWCSFHGCVNNRPHLSFHWLLHNICVTEILGAFSCTDRINSFFARAGCYEEREKQIFLHWFFFCLNSSQLQNILIETHLPCSDGVWWRRKRDVPSKWSLITSHIFNDPVMTFLRLCYVFIDVLVFSSLLGLNHY